jgi:hypothetical protein
LPGVLADLHLAEMLIRPAGAILVHDYGMPNWPRVTPAIDVFLAEHRWRIVGRIKSLVILRAAK